ncbi:MAG: hypothetical protein V1921_04200 [Candidatus Altiarchaeota archaeon]
MRKGILFTMLTVLLLLSVFILASYFSKPDSNRDIQGEKTRLIYDDIRSDFEDITGITVTVNQTSDTITISDRFPLENGTGLFERYESFINTTYAGKWNTNITLANVGDPAFWIFPYWLKYEYDSLNKTLLRVYNASGNADYVAGYNITLVFHGNIVNVSESTNGGTFEFYLNATFANGSHAFSGNIARDQNSTWFFDFGTSNFTMQAGKNVIAGEERNSTLSYRINGSEVTSQIAIKFQATEANIGMRPNLFINITDKVKKADYVWITPPTP